MVKHSGSGPRTQNWLSGAGGCLFVLLLLMALQSPAGHSQYRPPPPPEDEQDTIRVNVDLVVLHATVQDRSRVFVSGLHKEDFQVYENGVLQRIESFRHEDIPVTVGLVVDNSGSMQAKHPEVIAAALAFARSSHPQDQMFVVHFNENLWFGLPASTPFTDQEAQLQQALGRIKADGLTGLYDATAAAVQHLRNGRWEKKVLLVISDGADNASKHTLAQVLAQAQQANVILYTVGLFQVEDPDRNPGVLRRLAKETGGEAFLPERLKEVTPICEQIARDIRNQYTITYVSSNSKPDGTFRRVQVKVAAPGRGRLTVRTRAGYYARLQPPSASATRLP